MMIYVIDKVLEFGLYSAFSVDHPDYDLHGCSIVCLRLQRCASRLVNPVGDVSVTNDIKQ